MSESLDANCKPVSVGLLGAALDTGNMGVSALAESAIKCILYRWPNAEITLLDSGYLSGECHLRVGSRNVTIKELPIRFCRNVFFENHFVVLCFYAVLFKVFRWEKFKRFCSQRNASLKCIVEIDMVADITGGDSFSDIYGMRRFVLGFLRKWLVMLFGKDLIMLPQTYGPFKRRVARAMARHILNRASLIYSRDRAGIEYVNTLLNNRQKGKVRFAPDVAFVLDARKPEHLDIEPSADVRAQDSIVVGLNISGLLYNGRHTRNERFGLKTDYRQLVCQVARLLLENDKVKLLLVPHVLPPAPEVENDAVACLECYRKLGREYRGRILLMKGDCDQGEIKYIIGLCDFFIGSRMHSCIAALSQCIPAVGIAYSKKFDGVFESVGLAECVVDTRSLGQEQVLQKIKRAFENRDQIRTCLNKVIPEVKTSILKMLESQ